MNIVFKLNQYHQKFSLFIFIVCLLPAIYLFSVVVGWTEVYNPFATLIHDSAHIFMICLLLTLAIAPLRHWFCWLASSRQLKFGKRMADWNFLIRQRKQLGLWCFFYALVHVTVYLWLEMDWDWQFVWLEIFERDFIPYGWIALFLLALLAATSFNTARLLLGVWWFRLHKSIYLIAALSYLHHVYAVKPNDLLPLIYLVGFFVIALHHLVLYVVPNLRNPNDGEIEVYRKNQEN
ncbi:sulfite oxidase heme-binding subunit YedZ [Catenovulum sp. SX2]|uniref:sulfite oxidase heme-binding subunit YedZ n=1 Tax=Catenovulum sp. SX2 TaxID=3398614 RepID=UPI003F85CC76